VCYFTHTSAYYKALVYLYSDVEKVNFLRHLWDRSSCFRVKKIPSRISEEWYYWHEINHYEEQCWKHLCPRRYPSSQPIKLRREASLINGHANDCLITYGTIRNKEQYEIKLIFLYDTMVGGARGSVAGWGTMLQVGSSWVQLPMKSSDFLIDLILAALWHWDRLSL
jgi:hypothetical protein